MMWRRRGAAWLGWRGPIAVSVLVPVGIACAVGVLIAPLIEPHWRMGGYTFANAYPKNVEIDATLLAVGVGAASAVLVRWRTAWIAAWLIALAGVAAVARTWPLAPAAWLPGFGLAAALAVGLARRSGDAGSAHSAAQSRLGVALWVVLLTLATLMLSTERIAIDPYHDGSVLLSALDFLHGGRPFHSFIWAHGLHDTGIAALWILLTGKVGTSPVALTNASVAALTLPTLWLIARGGAFTPAAALLAAAAGVVTVAAVGDIAFGGIGGGIFLLRSIGLLVFVAAAFACVTRRPRPRYVLAGVLLGLAHLYRFEVSIYGVCAVGAVVAYRSLAQDEARPVRRLLGGLTRIAAGIALLLGTCHLAFGWPDAAWIDNVFALGAYHTGYNGLPFAWPRRDVDTWTRGIVWGGVAIFLALMLLAEAARRGLDALWPAVPCARSREGVRQNELIIFLAVLAAACLRTSLDRSDALHIAMWSTVPAWGALLLPLRARLERFSSDARRTQLGLAGLGVLMLVASSPVAFIQHLRANAPLGPCADTTFTAAEAELPRNWSFIEDTCITEQILRAHHVERLIIDHSAPWYSMRFATPQLVPQYMLNQAPSPAAQRAMIERWRAADAQAVLLVRGYSAIGQYDVHNMYQVPVSEAYLRARRLGARHLRTPVGELYLLDEAAAAPPPLAPAHESGDVGLFVDQVVFDPATGFIEAQGWAGDLSTLQPITDIAWLRDGQPERGAEAVQPLRRADAVEVFHAPDFEYAGWWLVARTAAGAAPPSFAIRATAADGRMHVVPVEPQRARRLPARSGREWATLGDDVAAAEAAGAADAAAARQRAATADRPGAVP